MADYVWGAEVASKIFTWQMIGWGIALVLIGLLITRPHKIIFVFAFIFDVLGLLCAAFVGLTALWHIGWFAWVIPLSGILFSRYITERDKNLSYIPDNKSSEVKQ